jgi:DNA-binding transcriptional ArsR family regulator
MEVLKLYHPRQVSATPTASGRIRHPDVAALDLATIMRTVGDPVRLAIVRLLADGAEHSCSDLQAALSIPASTGSYHLRLLREGGVTRTRADGTARLITLRRDDLESRFPGLVDVLTRS